MNVERRDQPWLARRLHDYPADQRSRTRRTPIRVVANRIARLRFRIARGAAMLVVPRNIGYGSRSSWIAPDRCNRAARRSFIVTKRAEASTAVGVQLCRRNICSWHSLRRVDALRLVRIFEELIAAQVSCIRISVCHLRLHRLAVVIVNPCSRRYPLTEPAIMPRTKKRCSEKKTISGTNIEMNAPAVSRCQS